ncbi:hypothetical protein HOLleu_22308 [Holothuria leucospilota]|uniref:NACHT domain-containing protein n=1 Tax=Holothuria leucospilota TaxID=206669 RepID=A0A9Q1BZ15_HOLLE|nr:hypothetical protein HOLleu_22308 [Holothuria leucospilota]
MESLQCTIGAFSIILLAVQAQAEVSCPNIYIAKESSRVIFCQSDRTIKDFYWYRGTKTTSSPILGLQNGIKGGTEYGSEHFDIFENGSMVMQNVKIEHESYYTFVGFYDLTSFDNATFLVRVTLSPDPPCPVITGCSPCEVCTIDAVKKSDTLTCRIIGARPLVPLSWNITSQSGISFVRYDAFEQRDEVTDSWDTYLSLDYEVTEPCGVTAKVQCIAEDMADITSSNIVKLHIRSELCSDVIPTTDDTTEAAGFGTGPLLALILVLLVLFISICILIGWCMYKKRRKEETEKRTHHEVSRGTLVKALASVYEKFCSLKPLPWGEPIPISALYSDFQCVVTPVQSTEFSSKESLDLENITSSEDLFTSDSFKNASRVIFIADLGYGKTTMTQHVVQQWIKEDTKNFILIYIQLKEVDIDQSIAAVVKDMLPSSMDVSVDAIKKVFNRYKVLVLLDGLDELSMSVEKDVYEGVENEYDFVIIKSNNGNETGHPEYITDDVTVRDLLKGKVRGLNCQMRVWVTSREVDDMKSPFPPPHVKIKMTGFSDSQIDAYIRNTCKYYCHSIIQSNPATAEAMIEDIMKKVRDNIEKNDIIQEFVNTPLLLVLIIHILTGKFTGTVTHLKDLQLTKLTTLVGTVITCLKSRYVQKIQDLSLHSKAEEIERKLGEIERKLGEIAWKQKLEITNYDRDGWDELLGTEYVNIALSTGLLRLSKQISNSNIQRRQLAFSSFTGVEFYHQYFLEYLAGQYFSTEGHIIQKLEKSLDKITDDKTIRFLQFMSGSGHPAVKKVSDIFLKNQENWNNFIDFIYETEDEESVKSYLEDLSGKAKDLGSFPVVNFKYLDKKYHQDAVSAFCEKCNKFDITIRAFTFRKDCPLEYLTGLVLPQLERIELLEMHIAEDDFLHILEWISRQKLPKTFQFNQCKFDQTLSPESKQKIKTAMEGKELNIYSNDGSSLAGWKIDCFNVKEGEWSSTYFPEEQ